MYKTYLKSIKNKTAKENNALTEREIEIIKLITKGLNHKQIAEKIFISVRTVETHKKNILEKLNLNNSVEIAVYAIKNGIYQL